MKVGEYLQGKMVLLLLDGVGLILLLCFLLICGVTPAFTAVLYGGIFLFTALYLAVDYLVLKRRLAQLENLLASLPERYLAGEVLPVPAGGVERCYYRVMKSVSASAIDAAETARREKEEYMEYVERWIHELKTPLTACSLILANQGSLCRGQVCQVAGRCAREIRRADNLTEDILYYARLRSADRDIRAVRFSAGRLLEEAVKRQMEILIAAKIRVELTGDFTAYGDEKSMSYMVQQLLVNAAKYCPGCRILLRAEGNRIVVEDDGIGVPSHELERITDRGFTGTNGEKFPNSTGMGLYVVKRLCEKLGIGFTVESEAGRYTRFTFSL